MKVGDYILIHEMIKRPRGADFRKFANSDEASTFLQYGRPQDTCTHVIDLEYLSPEVRARRRIKERPLDSPPSPPLPC